GVDMDDRREYRTQDDDSVVGRRKGQNMPVQADGNGAVRPGWGLDQRRAHDLLHSARFGSCAAWGPSSLFQRKVTADDQRRPRSAAHSTRARLPNGPRRGLRVRATWATAGKAATGKAAICRLASSRAAAMSDALAPLRDRTQARPAAAVCSRLTPGERM